VAWQGTGKSQVIKALMGLLLNPEMNLTDLLFVAPTGTAAALLLGSNLSLIFWEVPIDGQTAFRNETTNNAQVKARLDGVEYIFFG